MPSYLVSTYLTPSTQLVLNTALSDYDTGNQIGLRLINSTPASVAAAKAILSTLATDPFTILQIQRFLADGLAGDAQGKAGKEMASAINGMVVVLQAYVSGDTPAVAAHFTGIPAGASTSVTITANTAGTAGNVSIPWTGSETITAGILAWNTAHPTNQVTLTSGSGSQTPTAGSSTLSGGTNASNAALAPAQALMPGPMSAQTYLNLIDCLAGEYTAVEAVEIQAKYNAMITNIAAIVPA